jgi:type I restriction enzyme S subunit
MKYQTYPAYKDSGVEWLDNVPEHWNIKRTKAMFALTRTLVGKQSKDYQLLSLTLKGIVHRDISDGGGKIPAEFDTYQEVKKQDLVFCLFDIDETPRTIGLSSYDGMITGAYNVYRCLNICAPEYAYYYFMHIDSFKGLKPFYTGLRKVVRAETFSNIKIPAPALEEQQKIAQFLDHETAKIDTLIEKQQRLIELLKEKRQAVISHAVTKGLNPNAPMKESGVEWLGDVPEGWKVIQFKRLASIQNGRDYKHIETDNDDGYPVIGSGGEFAKATEYTFSGESVLLGRKGTIDKPLYINGAFWVVDTMFYTIVNTELAVVKYLYYCALTIKFDLYSTNTALPSMTQNDLGGIFFSIPEIAEQKNIVAFLDLKIAKFHELNSQAQQAIELLQERRTALISAAVTGKIDVRDWGD